MNFGQVSELEQAAWPVFRVDKSRRICGVNKAAYERFGERLETLQLSGIWTGANSDAHWNSLWQSGGLQKLTLTDKTQKEFEATVLISQVQLKGHEQLLFQVVGNVPAAPVEAPASQGVEVNLAHKQKLDCALHLTRTVALDFNNALTTILGHASFVLGQLEPGHRWRVSLAEIEKSAEKAAEIANQLALFSLEDKNKRSQIAGNLNALIRRAVQLFQTPDREGIIWSLQFENKLYSVSFDEAKMQQAFVKIIENAVEAMDERGGQLSVQTRNLELSEPTQDRTAHLAAGTYVCVEIKDDGRGIDPADLPRVFEPFFTTKYGHRGLGLAWVYGIVTNHRGGVAISSSPKQGASVRIYLPAMKKIIEENLVPDNTVKGTETILFVDDEEMVARLGLMVLSSVGYKVLTAHNGEQALEVFARSSGKIDLLVTDMVMPHMNGRELIEKVRSLFPATRIICSTACIRSLDSQEDVSYLQKPFTAQGLLQKVRIALSPTDHSDEADEAA
jgi:two-component system cell cycle sensor histidine kinase/response regulator CckA